MTRDDDHCIDEQDAAKALANLSHETATVLPRPEDVGRPPPMKKQRKTTMATRMIAREDAQSHAASASAATNGSQQVAKFEPLMNHHHGHAPCTSSRKRPAQRWASSSSNSSNTSNSSSSSPRGTTDDPTDQSSSMSDGGYEGGKSGSNSSDRGSSGSSEEDGDNGNDRCYFDGHQDQDQDQVCKASPQLIGQTGSGKIAKTTTNDSSSTGSNSNSTETCSDKGEKSDTTDGASGPSSGSELNSGPAKNNSSDRKIKEASTANKAALADATAIRKQSDGDTASMSNNSDTCKSGSAAEANMMSSSGACKSGSSSGSGGKAYPSSEASGMVLGPSPFFYYVDHSQEVDDDQLVPLTPTSRVPTFPSKMMALLSRSDLSNIIYWMPHGRSWRIINTREFERRVISLYFEHSKFSSFIRQAKGWGFRKITEGGHKNCYYNEFFLRGLPHLIKKMPRPGASKKFELDPEHEPDLLKISMEYPVPSQLSPNNDYASTLDAINDCILQGGPKARLPIVHIPSALKSLTTMVRIVDHERNNTNGSHNNGNDNYSSENTSHKRSLQWMSGASSTMNKRQKGTVAAMSSLSVSSYTSSAQCKSNGGNGSSNNPLVFGSSSSSTSSGPQVAVNGNENNPMLHRHNSSDNIQRQQQMQQHQMHNNHQPVQHDQQQQQQHQQRPQGQQQQNQLQFLIQQKYQLEQLRQLRQKQAEDNEHQEQNIRQIQLSQEQQHHQVAAADQMRREKEEWKKQQQQSLVNDILSGFGWRAPQGQQQQEQQQQSQSHPQQQNINNANLLASLFSQQQQTSSMSTPHPQFSPQSLLSSLQLNQQSAPAPTANGNSTMLDAATRARQNAAAKAYLDNLIRSQQQQQQSQNNSLSALQQQLWAQQQQSQIPQFQPRQHQQQSPHPNHGGNDGQPQQQQQGPQVNDALREILLRAVAAGAQLGNEAVSRQNGNKR